jgi:hypothetical protein
VVVEQGHGDECWELDAMDPNELRARVENEIRSLIDQEEWDRCLDLEKDEREIAGHTHE